MRSVMRSVGLKNAEARPKARGIGSFDILVVTTHVVARAMKLSLVVVGLVVSETTSFRAPDAPVRSASRLEHHKARSAVADLKIYRRMQSWETNEDLVDEPQMNEFEKQVASYVPVATTYVGTRKDGVSAELPLPAVFGGVGAAIFAASAGLSGGLDASALFSIPAFVGAAAFGLNQLNPVPLEYDGSDGASRRRLETVFFRGTSSEGRGGGGHAHRSCS